MIKFLMSLFAGKSDEKPPPPPVDTDRDFGFIDYDGMGNQGRFPTQNNKRGKKGHIHYYIRWFQKDSHFCISQCFYFASMVLKGPTELRSKND